MAMEPFMFKEPAESECWDISDTEEMDFIEWRQMGLVGANLVKSKGLGGAKFPSLVFQVRTLAIAVFQPRESGPGV